MVLFFVSLIAFCSASWLIRSFVERPLWAVPSDSDYYDTLPVDNSEYFSVGSKYNGEDQQPVLNDAGAQALYGCSAAEAEGKYLAEFVTGTYADESLGKIENPAHYGRAAGTHYYKITDKTTGQVISIKYEIVIEKTKYNATASKTPDKAVYFSGDELDLYVTWTNEVTGGTVDYIHNDSAEEFPPHDSSLSKEEIYDSTGMAYLGGVQAGIEQIFGSNPEELPYLKNNYDVETVDLTYKVLPRCYVEQSGARTYYSSLAYALESTKTATSDTLVVAVPSFVYDSGNGNETYSTVINNANGYKNEISSDCEIGSKVTLWIPYDLSSESSSNNGRTFVRSAGDGSTHAHQSTFGLDADGDGVFDWRKNIVTVKAGVTVTNKGKINISGEVTGGNGGTENAGFVAGRYAELQMKSNGESTSTLISTNGSIINCYGFITESLATGESLKPQIDMLSGSNMTTLFTIGEHRGGTAFLGLCDKSTSDLLSIKDGEELKPLVSPFNQFFMPSIGVETNVNYGATMIGQYVLFINNDNVVGNLTIIGKDTSAFLQVTNEKGFIKISFDHARQQNMVEVRTDAAVNPLRVSITISVSLGITIKRTVYLPTNNIYLPIAHYWHIDFFDMEKESGEPTFVNIPVQRIKILPGGYINMHEGIEASVKALTVYDSYEKIPDVGTQLEDGTYNFKYPRDKGEATLIVSGNLKITEALGGKITAGSAGAIISVASNSATSEELAYGGDPKQTIGVTLSAHSNILSAANQTPSDQAFSSNTEYTTIVHNNNSVWINRSINVTYLDVFTDDDGNIVEYGDTTGTTKPHTVYSNLNPGLSKSGYIVDGYYVDKDLTTEADSANILFSTKLYVKWKPVPTYEITYNSNYPDGSTGMTFSGGITDAPEGLFTSFHTSSDWNDDFVHEYKLVGWTDDPDGTEAKSEFTITEDGLTLYGVWVKKDTVTITIKLTDASVTLNGGTISDKKYSTNTTVTVIKGTPIKVTAEYNKNDDQTLTIGGSAHTSGATYIFDSDVTIQASSATCIAAGTLITLADGSVKKVEDLLETDILMVFDHETGKFVEAPITFIERDGWAEYNIINLKFSDGRVTRLIYEHALFDMTLNKYVYITEKNLTEFIGHEFAVGDGGEISSVTLTEAFVTTEYTGCYSLVTAYHLNYFIDGLFSIPGGIEGLFNIFEYGEGLKYDEEKMQADIEKYGLYTYEDFAEYIPEEVYNAFPAAYFKVSIGKGYLTFDKILEYIEAYVVKNGLM